MLARIIVTVLLLCGLARAETPAALDPRGRQIYDLLMNLPPSKKGDLAFVKEYEFEFVRASGRPRFRERDTSLAVAEVIYEFRPFRNSTENRIRFLIYPDVDAARRYIDGSLSRFQLDGPPGHFRSVIAAADPIFKRPQKYVFGIGEDGRKAWLRWAYQIDRVVIVGATNIDVPMPKDRLNPDLGTVPDELFSRGWNVAAIGRIVMQQQPFMIADD